MLIAVAVLFSVSYWLISKVEAAKWQQFIREKVTTALAARRRKGARVRRVPRRVSRRRARRRSFYQALFTEGAGNVALPVAFGIVVGFARWRVIFTLFHRYGVRIPAAALLRGHERPALLHGVRVHGEGNPRAAGRGRHVDHRSRAGRTSTRWGSTPCRDVRRAARCCSCSCVFALLKTFWPKRSVALPTVAPDPAVRAISLRRFSGSRLWRRALST